MADNIIILSDGTGNAAASVWRTNVWRTFQALNLEEERQAAKYDDGVGTSSFLPLAILGGAFGWGLKRNILEAYKFVCRNYQANANLFLFGFSRGAFTVRVLAALILEQGLVQASTESELHDLARKAYRAYRAKGYHSVWRIEDPLRKIRDFFINLFDHMVGRQTYDRVAKTSVPEIKFIGVWDTVAAYGLPADEMTRGFSRWIWPLELPNRILSDKVKFARHALSLDDERTTFHPVLWTEAGTAPPQIDGRANALSERRLVQVWFSGVHGNVGGGYPDDALAFVPLLWMVKEAARLGLDFKAEPNDDPDTVKMIRSGADKDGREYDSRAGLASYYRYGPRNVADLCKDADNGVDIKMPLIHESVFGRIDSGSNSYAPIGLPEHYLVATSDGRIVQSTFETPTQATARFTAQQRVWNYVWLRRIFYFLTLAASFHIVAFWLFHPLVPSREFNNPIKMVSEAVRLVGSVTPGAFHWWWDWYAANPNSFTIGLIVLVLLSLAGTALSGTISDLMRVVWNTKGGTNPVASNGLQNFIFGLRSNRLYQWTVWAGRMHVLPFFFFLAVAWFGLTFGSHLLFNIADSNGAFCHGDYEAAMPVNLGVDQKSSVVFETNQLCLSTKLRVKEGSSYRITMTITQPWDGATPQKPGTPTGFHTADLPFWHRPLAYLAVPLRRVMFRPWYRILARTGELGVDEYFLDPVAKKVNGVVIANTYTATFRADRDGELFLYVNDPVLALPSIGSLFYWHNTGTADVVVKLL